MTDFLTLQRPLLSSIPPCPPPCCIHLRDISWTWLPHSLVLKSHHPSPIRLVDKPWKLWCDLRSGHIQCLYCMPCKVQLMPCWSDDLVYPCAIKYQQQWYQIPGTGLQHDAHLLQTPVAPHFYLLWSGTKE